MAHVRALALLLRLVSVVCVLSRLQVVQIIEGAPDSMEVDVAA